MSFLKRLALARPILLDGVAGLLINCTPSATIHQPFAELSAAVQSQPGPVPIRGLYANIGRTNDIDGCCGTTPAHVAALSSVLH
jgi:methionine synthase I (cobalamin-dependent)